MKIFNYLFLLIFFYSCHSFEEAKEFKQPAIGSSGKIFFDYDEIEWYTNPIPERNVIDVIQQASKSENDSLKMSVLAGGTPKVLSDTLFLKKYKDLNYSLKIVDKSKFNEIDSIFKEKDSKENYATACIYVYRDILVFRKKSSIVGIAKICFGCMANQILGTQANIENFGQNGDYGKLRKLLYR